MRIAGEEWEIRVEKWFPSRKNDAVKIAAGLVDQAHHRPPVKTFSPGKGTVTVQAAVATCAGYLQF
jgi:hypothetical protein